MRSDSGPLAALGAFRITHTCICLWAGDIEGTNIVGTTRDDPGPGRASTSRTRDVSRAAVCQRQLVPGDFSALECVIVHGMVMSVFDRM